MDARKGSTPDPIEEKPDPSPATGTWVEMRDKLVLQALEDNDLPALRRISVLPGGYGSAGSRETVWPRLLRTHRYFEESSETALQDSEEAKEAPDAGPSHSRQPSASRETSTLPPHPDETQVALDTRRSFVTYPRGIPKESKLTMQAELHLLIVHILRKYPSLSYFQGFHDIMSTLYLTFIPLPPPSQSRSRSASIRGRIRSREASQVNSRASSPMRHANGLTKEEEPSQSRSVSRDDSRSSSPRRVNGLRSVRDVTMLPGWKPLVQCAEVVAVCRVRDAMGKSMDPMMGLLKILKRLLRAADPELDRFSSTISPVPTLPFFALSWILCLFSHDIDTLEPVQRMFDFLLARNPISAIYLAVAILMAKKKQMFTLAKTLGSEAREDPSLLHPLFARLPPLYPDTPDLPDPPTDAVKEKLDPSDDEPNPYDPIPLSRIFRMTDDLLARYPLDGPLIRGGEIMGPHSVVCTYDAEPTESLPLCDAQKLVESEVILPGATEPDEEPAPPPIKHFRRPRSKIGTVMAVGVVVLGVGIAMYGLRADSRSGWRGWWAAVVGSWVRSRRWVRRLDVDVLSLLRQRIGRLV